MPGVGTEAERRVATRSVTPVRMKPLAILAGYGLLAACSQLLWLSFAPITTRPIGSWASL